MSFVSVFISRKLWTLFSFYEYLTLVPSVALGPGGFPRASEAFRRHLESEILSQTLIHLCLRNKYTKTIQNYLYCPKIASVDFIHRI